MNAIDFALGFVAGLGAYTAFKAAHRAWRLRREGAQVLRGFSASVIKRAP